MNIEKLFRFFDSVIALKASDIHICANSPLMYRLNGNILKYNNINIRSNDIENIIKVFMPKHKYGILENEGEVDFAYKYKNLVRFRVNVYSEKSQYAIAIRIIRADVPDANDYNYPDPVIEFANLKRGIVLVTGPTGSGKTTLLAAIVNEINKTRKAHIITLEDTIEFIHTNKESIISQREIGTDTKSYSSALKACFRQDPDVILIGEMRDYETISTAITTAEAGHLVLSTMQTTGACKSINRIIDVFPPHQQNEIRMQLATSIEGVVSIQLVPHILGESLVAAYEIMKVTPAIRKMIRNGQNYQIISQMQTGRSLGMRTFDMSLLSLYKEGTISKETAMTYCVDKEAMHRDIEGIKDIAYLKNSS